MKSDFVPRLLVIAAGVAVLAGCSAGSAQLPGLAPAASGSARTVARATRKSWMAHVNAGTKLVYLGDQRNNEIVVFNQKTGAVVGEITESNGIAIPQGLFVDEKHNLWVVNGGAQNVKVFPRGSTIASKTLSDTLTFQPMDVAVCHNGTAYVTNNTNITTGIGSIEVYASGSTTPTGSLIYPNVAYEYFVTCDRKGNVFSTITNQYFSNDVVEFKNGQQNGATDLNIALNNPGAIKPDKAGNLLVCDQGANTIAEYTESGSPTGVSITLSGNVSDFAPSRTGTMIGASDLFQGAAFVWSWPQGVKQSMDYADPNKYSAPFGFAFDPGQKGFGS